MVTQLNGRKAPIRLITFRRGVKVEKNKFNFMKKKTKLFKIIVICILTFSLNSCTKEVVNMHVDSTNIVISQPNLIVNNNFPSGILLFNNRESVSKTREQLKEQNHSENTILGFFDNSFRNTLLTKKNKVLSVFNSTQELIETTKFDIKNKLTGEDAEFQELLTPDLQAIVNNKLVQITEIGTFEVNLNKIERFLTLFKKYEDSIFFNPNFKTFPNEKFIGKDINNIETFLVEEGIIRHADKNRKSIRFENDLDSMDQISKSKLNNDIENFTSNEVASSNSEANIIYEVKYGRSGSIWINDNGVTKSITLSIEATNINLYLLAYNTFGIKLKMEKRQTIDLGWMGSLVYWSPTFANEMIIHGNPVLINTDYKIININTVIDNPSNFGQIAGSILFKKVVNLKIGSFIFKDVIQANGWGQNTFTKTIDKYFDISSFIDQQLATATKSTFEQKFKEIHGNLINHIDRSYLNTLSYIEHTNRQQYVNFYIRDMVVPTGYTNKHEWTMDTNFGFSSNGNVTSATYSYTPGKSIILGKIRLGTKWYGIKLLYGI